eukprot:TRINITY_DN33504_c0_g1_i1.p1 TRINITY_DN33504_c0_g1~~TRINITY_DN33504_c0_g1_i1.p1  ORF type:complete len:530 (+),score=69.06 TRINITY_DN33504_c0_g1_i1:159-1748(+)
MVMPAGHLSPAAQAVVESWRALDAKERAAVIVAISPPVSLAPWVEPDVMVDDRSEPPVPAASRGAAVCWSGSVRGESVTGCPWCRRPLMLLSRDDCDEVVPESFGLGPRSPLNSGGVEKNHPAYVTVLYGPRCHKYFLGALVLGWSLREHGNRAGGNSSDATDAPVRVLMHTPDVPVVYLTALSASGWECREVKYLDGVAGGLFHNRYTSRFLDVFTKLRVFELVEYSKVLMLDLDMLVRAAPDAGPGHEGIASLFDLQPPAAMKRGDPVPKHGAQLNYTDLWAHPTRRGGDKLRLDHQASGINAGVMLFTPSLSVAQQMESEVRDWVHPEHYPTYMPEQEYLGRYFGTFECWSHIDCCFNYEIDKNERVPHDFTEPHKTIRSQGSHHPGVVVLHFSGSGVKPWDTVFEKKWDASKNAWQLDSSTLRVSNATDVAAFASQLKASGPQDHLDGYNDVDRLWTAIMEWVTQLASVSSFLEAQGHDIIALMRVAMAADAEKDMAASADVSAERGWKRSSWSQEPWNNYNADS